MTSIRHVLAGFLTRGAPVEGDTLETEMFRVRQDGTVVLMLSCI